LSNTGCTRSKLAWLLGAWASANRLLAAGWPRAARQLERVHDGGVVGQVQAQGHFVAGHRFDIFDNVVAGAQRCGHQAAQRHLSQDGAGTHALQFGFD
jgi:TRAP-type mannitol/chloroaromatic compound transport system substrate-binding protein